MNNDNNSNTFKYPLAHFEGQIHLIVNDDQINEHAQKLLNAKYLGFDTETKPSFKKGEVYQMALLQLATEDEAFLFRLHYLNQFELLKKIFENQEIIKVGLAIRDDIRGLQKIIHFAPTNFIELQDIAKKKNLNNFGLKGMTEEVLEQTISKKSKLTNWEAKTLSDSQLKYAATDAWIGLKLLQALQD